MTEMILDLGNHSFWLAVLSTEHSSRDNINYNNTTGLSMSSSPGLAYKKLLEFLKQLKNTSLLSLGYSHCI